jgi:hypothetical protein
MQAKLSWRPSAASLQSRAAHSIDSHTLPVDDWSNAAERPTTALCCCWCAAKQHKQLGKQKQGVALLLAAVVASPLLGLRCCC